MKNRDISVGVTALKTVESPQPGFAVARSLKDAGYKVIGIDDTPLTAAIVAPYFDAVYVTKSLRTENFAKFRNEIKNIKRKEGLDVLIPCYDKDVFFFVKYKRQIEELGIKMLLPKIDTLKLTSKPFLDRLGKFGILTPRTIIVSEKKDLKSASNKLGFPLVCKGVIKDAYIAKNLLDTLIFFDRIREIWHGGKGSVILQEFIAGEFYCVAGVADSQGKLLQQIQMKKLGVDSKGTTWSGVTIKDKTLSVLTKKIINSVKWIGPFELEFVKKYSDGKFYLFEINPRMPSWIYLSVIAGQNLPEITVKTLLGQKIKRNGWYKKDLVFVRYMNEVTFPLSQIKNKGNLKIATSV